MGRGLAPILNVVTFEKIKEIIRLYDEAHLTHEGGAGDARDPQRDEGSGRDGVTRPSTPPEPQPAADWRAAFERYLLDLPDPALNEVAGLYRYGRGEYASLEEAVSDERPIQSHQERAAFLASRSDLGACLKGALDRL